MTYWILAAAAAVLAVVLAYRLGAATMRPQVRALTAQLEARQQVEATVAPLQQAMASLQGRVDDAERARVETLGRLSEQVLSVGREVTAATREVHGQAQRITQALSRTQNQGTWGEMQLRRLVEAAGMLDHVHFTEQVGVDAGALRPDMVIDLGEDRRVVVDAKVSLDAFLDPDLDEAAQSRAHAAAVAEHVNRLSGKQYWRAVGTPEFVMMFLPSEHMLGIALRERPDLLQAAFAKKVVLATPTTLMATLRSVSWAWQQAAMAGQAREVLAAGETVHQRLNTMTGHVIRLGKDLGDAVSGYNQFVGSLETRVMPAARRLADLAALEGDLAEVTPIDVRPRSVAGEVAHDTG
jgi:DNA recombination protein RmuC